MADILTDTLLDGAKLLPFLFLTYLMMETLEHHTAGRLQEKIRTAGTWGPVWGEVTARRHSTVRLFGGGFKPFCRKGHHGGNAACNLSVDLG